MPDAAPKDIPLPDVRRSKRILPSPALPPLSETSDDVRFADAVLGSMLGALFGGALGGLIISAAAENEDRRPFEDDENSPEGVALLLIAGGPPVGAVLNTEIPRDHGESYALGGMGELILGGGGAALGSALGGDSEDGQLVGALALGIPGVVFGAAGGAVLGAPDRSGSQGAVRYRDGEWNLGPPTVRPGIHLHPEPGLHGTVSLVTVEL